MEYIFYAANKRYKLIQAFSIAILFINMLALAYISYINAYKLYGFAIAIFLLMVLFFLLKKKSKSYAISLAYAAAYVGWSRFEIYTITIPVFLLWLLYISVKDKFSFTISNSGVATNTSLSLATKNTTPWSSLNNIILKDGVLTIDYKDNKVLQTEVNEDFYINEAEFNEFCRKKLTNSQQ